MDKGMVGIARSLRRGRRGTAPTAILLVLALASPAWAATWRVAPSPNLTRFDNVFWGVGASSSGGAWAVGYADTGTLPTRRPVIERWKGGRWRITPSPLPPGGGELRDVAALSPAQAWTVGFTNTDGGNETLTEHWDGSAWNIVPSPNIGAQNFLLGIEAFSDDDVWAVGSNNVPGSLATDNLVEHWNGTSWTIVPSPDPSAFANQLNAVDGVSSDDVWAVGNTFDFPDDVSHPEILHWNGSAWAEVPAPSVRNASLEGVVAIAPDDVWAVGWRFSVPLLWQVPYAIHWDGTRWTSVPMPVPSPHGGQLYEVTALSPTNIYAVGHTSTDVIPSLAMHWDGTSWAVEETPSPAPVSYLWDVVSVAPNKVVGVGYSQELIHGNLGPRKTFVVGTGSG